MHTDTSTDTATLLEPTLVADRFGLPIWSRPIDGPVTGALIFRVGVGDEPLTRRGITHLVEHLTLADIHDPALQWNGFVDLNRTVFHATGPQDRVEQFLQTVAARLTRPALERLDLERDILAAEARRRGTSLAGELCSRRWGTEGWGASGWWEMAVGSVRAEQVDQWRRAFFSRGNAVVTLTATPSPEFALDLPDGPRIAPPLPHDVVSGRAWFRHETNVVGFMVRTERNHAASFGAQLVIEAMRRQLRAAGLCYSAEAAWHRLDLRRAALIATFDAVPQREAELARGVAEIFDACSREIPRELFDELRGQRDRPQPDDEARAALDSWSLDLLLGRPRTSMLEERAAQAAISRANVQHEIEEMRDDLLMVVPPGAGVSIRDLPPYPVAAVPTIEGTRHDAAYLFDPADARAQLTVGERGVSLATATGTQAVAWASTACVMRWSDGSRYIVDRRGHGLLVEPSVWEDGAEATARIDVAAPDGTAVQIGARYAPPARAAAPAHVVKVIGRLRTLVVAVLLLCIGVGPILLASPVPMVGLVVLALGIVGTPLFARWSTRRPRPMVWDDGNRRTNVPTHLDRSTWYIPGGLLLGWAVRRGHLAPAWAAACARDVQAFVDGAITGPQLYRRMGGVLADDLFDDVANEFFTDFLAQRTRGYDRELGRATNAPSHFEAADTAQLQQRADAVIDESFAAWHRWGRWSTTRHLRRATRLGGDGRWTGPQADEFGVQLVQRRRRRKWRRAQ